MLIDTEITALRAYGIDKYHLASQMMRGAIVMSTVALEVFVVIYHCNEILLRERGEEGDWLLILSGQRFLNLLVEMVICGLCPVPGSDYSDWEYFKVSIDPSSVEIRQVPEDTIFAVLMLLRFYQFTRFLVYHSRFFQHSGTRAVAAMNKVTIDSTFVFKTLLEDQPIKTLVTTIVVFLIAMAWAFTQFERWFFVDDQVEHIARIYYISIWFVWNTFILNGYGDIVPRTQAGRILSVVVAVFGAVASSLLIAVAAHRIVQSEAQKNVSTFLLGNTTQAELRNTAALVIQCAYRKYMVRYSSSWKRHKQRKQLWNAIETVSAIFRDAKNAVEVNSPEQTDVKQILQMIREMRETLARVTEDNRLMRKHLEVMRKGSRLESGSKSTEEMRLSNIKRREGMSSAKTLPTSGPRLENRLSPAPVTNPQVSPLMSPPKMSHPKNNSDENRSPALARQMRNMKTPSREKPSPAVNRPRTNSLEEHKTQKTNVSSKERKL
ncbi:unnamed protein product [Caenorhabditis auriculariae]|uniref:Potassium channel domain-containing protein n=1 Tax=Caenorhabditis auriculariae TaxID=2777116 RepID=A0A8S1HMH0_9PELO|nr:unnamed protein product [Caenorhabditis auriculariae]